MVAGAVTGLRRKAIVTVGHQGQAGFHLRQSLDLLIAHRFAIVRQGRRVEGSADDQDALRLMLPRQHLADTAAHVGFADQVFVVVRQGPVVAQAAAELEDLAHIGSRLDGVLEVPFPPGLVVRLSREASDGLVRIVEIGPRVFAGLAPLGLLGFVGLFLGNLLVSVLAGLLGDLVQFQEDGGRQIDKADVGLVADAPGEGDPFRRVFRQGIEDGAHRAILRVSQKSQRRPGVLVDQMPDLIGGVGRSFDQDRGGP